MDKRRLATLFQQRLNTLFDRSRQSQAAFAAAIDIDRSALSQLLSTKATRLPRVETLLNIAERHAVSLDWLLGLSQDEGVTGAMLSSLDIERAEDDGQTLLTKWHAEARGSKIRYVPSRIPDLLRREYDRLAASYIAALDPAAQRQAAGQIQRLLLDETPVIISYFSDWLSVTSNKITGVRPTAISQLFLDRAAPVATP